MMFCHSDLELVVEPFAHIVGFVPVSQQRTVLVPQWRGTSAALLTTSPCWATCDIYFFEVVQDRYIELGASWTKSSKVA